MMQRVKTGIKGFDELVRGDSRKTIQYWSADLPVLENQYLESSSSIWCHEIQ